MIRRPFHVKISWAQEKTSEQFLTLFPKYLPCPWTLSTSPPFHLFQTSGWLRFHWPHHCREILPWHWTCHLHWSWMFGHSVSQHKPAPNQEIPTVGQELFPKGDLDGATIFWRPEFLTTMEILAGTRGQRAAVTPVILLLPAHPACAGLICTWWASGAGTDLVYSWRLKLAKSNICLWTKDDSCLCDT